MNTVAMQEKSDMIEKFLSNWATKFPVT